ncbi:unnamed protein product [Lupinus luteus]|uniref:LisH domain-containing protein n=1 Tax=Lupinus luteus TaxID=3873 RepID=A0AAV1XZP7_LUPLU
MDLPSNDLGLLLISHYLQEIGFYETARTGCRTYALSIVEREFTQFETLNPRITEEAIRLVEMRNPRSHPMLQNFHRQNMRMRVAEEVKGFIRINPIFNGKLEYPSFQVTFQRLVDMAEITNGPNGRVISLLRNPYTYNRIRRNDSGNGN